MKQNNGNQNALRLVISPEKRQQREELQAHHRAARALRGPGPGRRRRLSPRIRTPRCSRRPRPGGSRTSGPHGRPEEGGRGPALRRLDGQRSHLPGAMRGRRRLTSRVMVFPVRVLTKICMAKPAPAGERRGECGGQSPACGRGARAHPDLLLAQWRRPERPRRPPARGFTRAGGGAGGAAGLRLPERPAAAAALGHAGSCSPAAGGRGRGGSQSAARRLPERSAGGGGPRGLWASGARRGGGFVPACLNRGVSAGTALARPSLVGFEVCGRKGEGDLASA